MPDTNDKTTMSARPRGFTLIELMIVVTIIGILAAVAYPSYVNSVTKSKRRAAQACLSNLATHMERFYTTNLRYDEDSAGNAIVLPTLNCISETDEDYVYGFQAGFPTRTTYVLQATTIGAQDTSDTKCGDLRLSNTGTRTVTGTATADDCW